MSDQQATISILAEVPEQLHEALTAFLETHSDWDHDRLFCAALSLFLIQNGSSTTPMGSQGYKKAARVYLDSIFREVA